MKVLNTEWHDSTALIRREDIRFINYEPTSGSGPIVFVENRIKKSPGLLFMLKNQELVGATWQTIGNSVFLRILPEKEGCFVEMFGICLNGRLKLNAPESFNLNHPEARELWLKLMDKLDAQAPCAKQEIH